MYIGYTLGMDHIWAVTLFLSLCVFMYFCCILPMLCEYRFIVSLYFTTLLCFNVVIMNLKTCSDNDEEQATTLIIFLTPD